MISSASTLFLATLVFNAASVFGAPLRYPDARAEVVVRAEIAPVQPVARAAVVDVQPVRRRSKLGSVNRRSARIVSEREPPPEFPEARDILDDVEVVEKRETDQLQRRYPRRVYHDFYVKRSPEPATTIKETTLMITKTTVHDTPADAAALNPPPVAGGVSPPIVPPVVPGAGTESTIVSISQTTTIAGAGGANAAPTPVTGPEVLGVNGATATISGDAAAPTPPPVTPPVAGAVVDTPPPVAGADGKTPPVAGAPGDAPPVAGGDSTAATTTAAATSATETGTPPTPPTGDATGAADNKPADDKAAGDKPAADATADDKKPDATAGDDKTPPVADAGAATGDAPVTVDTPPAATGDAPVTVDTPPAATDGGVDPAAAGTRRAVKGTNQPIMRRVAVSGASWASAVRRQASQH
ncbi:hypothetical protein B0H34DRAFT_801800 [Crassisporium funariophilum]|nr:hypothetical protein B0H34DRAFT_801800 [Crassisporium funariophilum]